MGMFDRLFIPVEGPDGECHREEFQTKDLVCNLDTYRVTLDGRLIMRRFDDDSDADYEPSDYTGVIHANGPIAIKATFSHGRLTRMERWR